MIEPDNMPGSHLQHRSTVMLLLLLNLVGFSPYLLYFLSQHVSHDDKHGIAGLGAFLQFGMSITVIILAANIRGRLDSITVFLKGLNLTLAIIGIFSALVFFNLPVFESARDKARQTSCMENIKQLSLGLLTYAEDHNEKLPDAAHWVQAISPYIANKKVFHCPADERPESVCSYAMNSALSKADLNTADAPAIRYCIFDSSQSAASPHGSFQALDRKARHNGGYNMGFLDGHVKWIKMQTALSAPDAWLLGTQSPKGQAALKEMDALRQEIEKELEIEY